LVALSTRGWRPYAAPAAFLLAATVAILVARGLLHHEGASPAAPPPRHAAKPHAAARKLYTVRAGDTLAAIAAKTHVPLARIQLLNPGLQPTALFIGQKIRLQ
jgi:Tfp pilus assembly protein FimV